MAELTQSKVQMQFFLVRFSFKKSTDVHACAPCKASDRVSPEYNTP